MTSVLDTSPSIRHRISELIDRVSNWQWVRYGVSGVLAAAVDLGIFYILATRVLPCIDTGFGDDVRAFRFVIDKTTSFVIANGFSYWLNVRWVFTPGRHKRLTELSLFFGISSLSYLVGAQLGRWLIADFAISSSLAAVVSIGASFVMNFVLRKTLVFRR